MIEIKHTNGTVLYTAENATDVRQALMEAVAAGANLAHANLADANLTGANLTHAYLTDANLAHANLTGAYLADANLTGANLAHAYLADANLARANLAHAYLTGAYLAHANLARANLAHANLTDANLTDAYLAHANLAGAYLADAKGINPHRANALLMLLDQPGLIRAYKLVTQDGYGPFNGGVRYEIGQTVEVGNANTDPGLDCAAGINVATLPWCMREWRTGYRILVVEFTAADIAAIPIGDGKFRLHRCTVVGEKNLTEIGLVS